MLNEVVYLAFSTSNHNPFMACAARGLVVYLAFSTSNHNLDSIYKDNVKVVYLAFSTSNHNYIKLLVNHLCVVYLAFSTSNHNNETGHKVAFQLYILRFLHQTTTNFLFWLFVRRCISCVFYIKPQQNFIRIHT